MQVSERESVACVLCLSLSLLPAVTKAQASAVFEVEPSSGGPVQYIWMVSHDQPVGVYPISGQHARCSCDEHCTLRVLQGNQWNSGLSETPPGPRNHDLLFWGMLHFASSTVLGGAQGGAPLVQQLEWHDSIEIEVPTTPLPPPYERCCVSRTGAAAGQCETALDNVKPLWSQE